MKEKVKEKVNVPSKELSSLITEGLIDKKGVDIVIMDLRKVKGAICDYFVVATGTSDRHVKSLADSVEDVVRKKALEKPMHCEGTQLGEWVLMDYVNVVVHIFLKEKRDFYRIEDLWGDAEFEAVKS